MLKKYACLCHQKLRLFTAFKLVIIQILELESTFKLDLGMN